MKNVLVIGGGGYIGCVLVPSLLEAGYKVTVVDRFFFGEDKLPLEEADKLVLVRDDIRFIQKDVFLNQDMVVDLSGLSNDPSCELDPKLTLDINYSGAIRIAKLAKKYKIKRFLFSSSCSVYGRNPDLKLTEGSELLPVSEYARMKVKVEKDLLAMTDKDFEVVLLRNATVYGYSPRMRFDLIINIMVWTAFEANKIRIYGGGRQWRPLIHIKDVVKAIKLVLESPSANVAGEIFNVGADEQNYQVIQVANIIKSLFLEAHIEQVSSDTDIRSYNVCFKKIKNKINFTPDYTPLEGAEEIKELLTKGELFLTQEHQTVNFYKHLLEAERLFKKHNIKGEIF